MVVGWMVGGVWSGEGEGLGKQNLFFFSPLRYVLWGSCLRSVFQHRMDSLLHFPSVRFVILPFTCKSLIHLESTLRCPIR